MLRRVLGAWRRSITLRVVTATLALSATVLAGVGQLVLGGVRDGLLENKVSSSLAQADAGFASARARLLAAGPIDQANVGQLLTAIVTGLREQAGRSSLYEIAVIPAPSIDTQSPAGRGSRTTGGIAATSVPAQLSEELARGTRTVAFQYVSLCYGASDAPCPRSGTDAVPGFAVGTQFRVPGASAYQLVFLFPLTNEERTLNLVRSRLAIAGGLITVLLAAIAGLVTRSVVRPVRAAARVAERLAKGDLSERMFERGEDDLAKLASSFNEMASALQRQIGQLEDLSRVQRRFVADVSHELRTPLTTIRMAADVLHASREDFSAPLMRSAELMHDQVERFEAMLGELLEISRFDAGAAVLEAEPTDVRDVVRRVATGIEPVATAQYDTTLRVHVPDSECVAEVDPRRIERILRNLVVNALEHGEGRGVVIRVAADAVAVAVVVRDYGVGLRPGEDQQVFDRFWRADPARARRSGGTGLGLSIALEDARLHGGWLQAWGEPGGGTAFRLTLPRIGGAALAGSPIELVPTDRRRTPQPGPVGHFPQALVSQHPRVLAPDAGRGSDD
ncbi:MAG: MtrAB system histidine kinase MtrB [Sporichthyaceae bacterium]